MIFFYSFYIHFVIASHSWNECVFFIENITLFLWLILDLRLSPFSFSSSPSHSCSLNHPLIFTHNSKSLSCIPKKKYTRFLLSKREKEKNYTVNLKSYKLKIFFSILEFAVWSNLTLQNKFIRWEFLSHAYFNSIISLTYVGYLLQHPHVKN